MNFDHRLDLHKLVRQLPTVENILITIVNTIAHYSKFDVRFYDKTNCNEVFLKLLIKTSRTDTFRS